MTSPTVWHAGRRSLVALPDGAVGRLLGVSGPQRIAVVVCGGRHRRLPARMLTVLDDGYGDRAAINSTGPLTETPTTTGGN